MTELGGQGAPRKDGSTTEPYGVVQIALRVLDEELAAWRPMLDGLAVKPSYRHLEAGESDGEV